MKNTKAGQIIRGVWEKCSFFCRHRNTFIRKKQNGGLRWIVVFSTMGPAPSLLPAFFGLRIDEAKAFAVRMLVEQGGPSYRDG